MKDKNLLENPTELLLREYEKECEDRSHHTPDKDTRPQEKRTESAPKCDVQIKETRGVALYKTLIFGTLLTVMFFIGTLFFLRPSFSDTENRELTKFPKFEIGAILNGEFFTQVDKWYADTFPGRDVLFCIHGAFSILPKSHATHRRTSAFSSSSVELLWIVQSARAAFSATGICAAKRASACSRV